MRKSPLAAVLVWLVACSGGGGGPSEPSAPATLDVSSPNFRDGGTIPRRFTCDGEGAEPLINFTHVGDTGWYAIVVTDPDAPGGPFVHEISYGEIHQSIWTKGANSAGGNGWTPPCPPPGDDPHHYVFKVYAVAKGIATPDTGSDLDGLFAAMDDHVVATGSITATYARSS